MTQDSAMASDTRSNNLNTGVSFSKVVQKHAGRAKEKILQNLGKADKTTDETFSTYESNFLKQQAHAARLHREVANYIRCARALQGASKALHETLQEVFEADWAGGEMLYSQAQTSDALWADYLHRLQDHTMAPLTAYQAQFPELKKKIDKRGRKLTDYDSQRHQLEALQRSTKQDTYKLARCRDQLDHARTTYDHLNKELYAELPEVHESRVGRTAETVSSLFGAEAAFLKEAAKVSVELESAGHKLAEDVARGAHKTPRGEPVTLKPVAPGTATLGREETGRNYEEIAFEAETKQQVNGNGTAPVAVVGTTIPKEATTSGLAAGVLYQVRTTFRYTREDVDELEFDVDELINVVEYDDPEEQEEGWLCGYKVADSSQKGLFPANFTKVL